MIISITCSYKKHVTSTFTFTGNQQVLPVYHQDTFGLLLGGIEIGWPFKTTRRRQQDHEFEDIPTSTTDVEKLSSRKYSK